MAYRALLTVLIVLAAPRIVEACSCAEMPPCQRFWLADAVFTGVVTSVTYSHSDDKKERLSQTTIVVDRGFRGASGQVVVIGAANGTCHYSFTVGRRYFVYAGRRTDGTLTTSICSGNKLLSDADADLDHAERLPPPGSGGRVFGYVRRIEQDRLDRRKSQDKFPADVAITIRDSSGRALELRTDAQGQFEAVGVTPGTYSVLMDAPATARVYSPTTIEVKDRGCVRLSFAYQSNGRIAGQIVDANGLPAGKVWVSVFPSQFTTKKEYPEVNMQTKITDAAGRYEIGPLPPGEYQLGVNVELPPRLESPYPRTYYPGVLTRAEAETIGLREGEMRRANFMLPAKLARLTVSGTVVFPDGTPARNVDVSLVAGTVIGISTSRTNATGAFTLTGLSNSTYSLRASFYTSEHNNASAETSISLAEEAIIGLKLALKKH